MTGLLFAATAAFGATAPAAATGAEAAAPAAGASSSGDLAVTRVTFTPLADNLYSKGSWMVIEVDFQGRASGKSAIINDVSVTLSLAWANPGATPPVDLSLSSTLKLIGVFAGKPNAVFFFVPPETLARAVKGQPYDASRGSDYYAVEFKIGENTLPLGPTSYSSTKLNATSAKSFIAAAESNGVKGLMFSQATVPFYIMSQALQKVSSNILPTPVSPDAGH